jgi:hypothetical protein
MSSAAPKEPISGRLTIDEVDSWPVVIYLDYVVTGPDGHIHGVVAGDLMGLTLMQGSESLPLLETDSGFAIRITPAGCGVDPRVDGIVATFNSSGPPQRGTFEMVSQA